MYLFILLLVINALKINVLHKICTFESLNLMDYCTSLCLAGVELQLRMAGDSRVLMDHNMEIGVTPAHGVHQKGCGFGTLRCQNCYLFDNFLKV